MMHPSPETGLQLGKLRAQQFLREAEAERLNREARGETGHMGHMEGRLARMLRAPFARLARLAHLGQRRTSMRSVPARQFTSDTSLLAPRPLKNTAF